MEKRFGNVTQACSTIHAVSLPAFPKEKQVRPAFSVTVELAGKQVRFVTVHLKSGCVSPLDGDALDGNTGPDDPCPTLQEQVAPLEGLFEGLGSGVDHFIVLGDFNRNLWHEANRVSGAEAVRSDGTTDLTTPRAANVRTRNLLLEVNDGVPTESTAVLLSPSCAGSPAIVAACEMAKTTTLSGAQLAALTAPDGLGCRNPVGLDHVLVSQSLGPAVRSVSKVSIGTAGRSLGANPPDFPDPLLAVSDHCPLVAEIDF